MAASTAPPGSAPAGLSQPVAEPAFWIAVASPVSEAWPGAEEELLGTARMLAGAAGGVVLVRLGPRAGAADAGQGGADRLVETGRGPEALAAALDMFPARHVLFAEGREDGDLARRTAVRLGERPAFGVQAIAAGRLVARGAAGRQDIGRPLPRLMVLARNRFLPYDGPVREALHVAARPSSPAASQPHAGTCLWPATSGLPQPAARAPTGAAGCATGAPAPAFGDLGTISLPAAEIPLTAAELILSAGEGVTDWPAFHALSAALDAAEAGSRQVCDAGHLPRDRQVGASGTLVEARGYLAFGISGAPQHLQGVQRCRFVVAVNTDLHAAMVHRADLAIIADAQEVMPVLSRLLGDALS